MCVAGGKLFISDSGNHRVLVWNAVVANGQPADYVVGQSSLSSTAASAGAIGLQNPYEIACGPDYLLVADGGNNRVLVFRPLPKTNAPVATITIGQASFNTVGRGAGADGLYAPVAATLLADSSVAVTDSGNHRILSWARLPEGSGAPAAAVLGQSDFAGDTPDHGGVPGADSVDSPGGLLASDNGLWVADRSNNRVLFFRSPLVTGAAAVTVFGQADFASTLANRGGAPTADSLSAPQALCSDGEQLAIVDSGNHRVLVFPHSPPVGSPVVLGQPAVDMGAESPLSASTLRVPRACVFLGGALFVADSGNNRVVRFSPR